MKLDNIELSNKEIELVRSFRKKQELIQKAFELERAIAVVYYEWNKWSQENGGRGLTYSTFNSGCEFNVESVLVKIGIDVKYNKAIYYAIKYLDEYVSTYAIENVKEI